MIDDGIPAMEFKLLCTSLHWVPKDGILIWHQDKNGKCMLADGDPKPCKPDSIKNWLEIIKGIFRFIEYWKEMCEENISRGV